MNPPPAGFGEPGIEILGRRPRPARLEIGGGVENVEILLTFALRSGLDEHEELGARHPVCELEAMARQLVAGRLPFLARPSGKEFQLVTCQFHGVLPSA
jgi:hypothetical protein